MKTLYFSILLLFASFIASAQRVKNVPIESGVFDGSSPMITDNNGTLWVATNGAGIAKLVNGEFVYYNTSNSNLTGNYTYTVIRDSTGHIWCSALTHPNHSTGVRTDGENGLFRIENGTLVAKPIPNRNTSQIQGIACDRKGKVWVALSDEKGIAGYNNLTNTWDVKTVTSSPSNVRAYYINIDKKNRKWISMQFQGYAQYNDTAFTAMSLVNHYDRFFTNPAVDDTVWIASNSGSFKRYNPNRIAYSEKTASSLGISSVNSMSSVAFDRYGGKWYTTNDGVVYQGCDTTIRFDLGSSSSSIYIDERNTKWIAPYSVGLSNLIKLTDVKAEFSFNTAAMCSGTAISFGNISSDLCRLPLTYKWNFGDGTPEQTSHSPAHTFTQAGTYPVTLIATNPRGIADTITQDVVVISCTNIAPNFFVADTVCMRTPVTIQNTTTGIQIASYLWKVPYWTTTSAVTTNSDTLYSTDVNPTFSINVLNQNSPYVNVPVTLIVTDSSGVTYTLVKNVVVAAPVQVRIIGTKFTPPSNAQIIYFSDTTVCENSGFTFNAVYVPFNSIFYTATTTVKLYRNDTLVHTGIPTDPLSPYIQKTGTYYIITGNSLTSCADTSQKVKVTYKPKPKLNIQGDTAVCVGSSKQLFTHWQDSTQYQWYQNGNLLPSATDTSIQVNAAGIYQVRAVNQCGCRDSVIQAVVLDSVATFNLTVTPLSTCLNDSSKIVAPQGFSNYLWSNGSTSSSITVTDTVTYSVTVTNSNGCSGVAKAKAPYQPLPVVTIANAGNSSFCAGDSTTLFASGAFGQFLWNTGATTQFIKVKTQGQYYYQVKVGGCWVKSDTTTITVLTPPSATLSNAGNSSFCIGDSTTLTVSGSLGVVYLWNNGATTPSIKVKTQGQYFCRVKVGDCWSYSDTVFITVTPIPTASVTNTGSNAICMGDSTILLASGTVGQFLWNTGATTQFIKVKSQGKYSYRVNTGGCVAYSDTVNITVNPLPTLFLNFLGDTILCKGASVALRPDTALAGNYNWNRGDTTISIIVNKTGIYYVDFRDKAGCKTRSNEVAVLVNGISVVDVLLIGRSVLCLNDTVSLLASQSGKFEWNTGDTTQLLKTAEAGYYFVKVLLSNGCEINSDTVYISNATPPSVRVLVEDSVFCEVKPSVLTAQTSLSVSTYEWYQNGIKISGATSPTLETRESGVYFVKVGDGCQVSVSPSVRLKAERCDFIVPNVITPNHDGANDVLKITDLSIYQPLSLKIYNRWGQLVYENAHYENDWSGDKLPSGTYFIHLSAPYVAPYKGWLDILR